MFDALEKHDRKFRKGGKNSTNLRFANDIDALTDLVERLNKTRTRYKMEISANSANGIQREIKDRSFRYLGAADADDGSKPEALLRIEQATAAHTKLKPIWRDNII